MARKLIVEIIGDTRKLEQSYDRASKATKEFGRSTDQTVGRIRVGIGSLVKATAVIGGVQAAFRGLSGALGASVEEWKQQQQVAAQTAARLTSTGGVAGVTADQVDKLATSISNYSGIDDEAIKAGENMLLTFTQIRNVAGKNNDIFNQATKATADLATSMNKGAAPSMDQMQTASLQVGKALNDPIRGYARLQRIGVQFSKAQIQQIKHFTQLGDVQSAQRVILRELNKEFGTSAREMGKSLPGELNRIRESLKNVGGSLVGTVAPGAAAALEKVNDFVKRVSEAKTVRAKLRVVWEGIEAIGRELFDRLRDAVTAAFNYLQQVDWGRFVRNVIGAITNAFQSVNWGQLAHNVGAFIANAFQSVNWAAVISRAGQLLGNAISGLANFLRSGIEKVNWQQVGKYLVDGIAIAVGALIKFLKSVDWVAVAKAILRLLAAAFKGLGLLFQGIGEEVGRLLHQALKAGLEWAGRKLKELGYKIALDIIEPFTHLPKRLGGGPFQRLKEQWQQTLDDMEAAGKKGGAGIAKTTADSIGKAVSAADIRADVPFPAPTRAPTGGGAKPPGADTGKDAAALKKARDAAARLVQLRNQWFDAMVGRQLDRLQDLPLKQQIAGLERVAGLIEQRIAVTKDITRRLNLEDRLLDVKRQERAAKQQAFLDSLSFGVERAQATQGVNDDIAALQATNAGLEKLNREYGVTTDRNREIFQHNQEIKQLKQQQKEQALDWMRFRLVQAEATTTLNDDIKALQKINAGLEKLNREYGVTRERTEEIFQNQQQILEKRKQQRTARQFRQLGLGPTGEALIPTGKQLLKRLGRIQDAVVGTVLDTNANRKLLANIRRTLVDGLGKLEPEVRQKVQELLDAFDPKNARRKPDPWAGFKLGQVLPSGLTGPGLPAGVPVPAVWNRMMRDPRLLPGPLAPGGVTINGGLHLHGIQNVGQFENELLKRAGQRPQTRRGPV